MNPISAILNGAASQNNAFSRMAAIKNMMTGKDPNAVYQQMMNTNPQFKRFVESNRGKSPEQIARENGIDLNAVMSLFK